MKDSKFYYVYAPVYAVFNQSTSNFSWPNGYDYQRQDFTKFNTLQQAEKFAEDKAKSGVIAYILETIRKYSPSPNILIEDLSGK